MRRARPLTEVEHRQHVIDADKARAWNYRGVGDDGTPFERKRGDWGWLDGMAVAVDYANLTEEDLRQIYSGP